MEKNDLCSSNKEFNIYRSISNDQVMNLPLITKEEKINNKFPNHLPTILPTQIDFSKYIIDPKVSKTNDSTNLIGNNSNTQNPQNIKTESSMKKYIIPLSEAREKLLDMMKISNREYMNQVENMNHSEASLNQIKNIIKSMGPIKFDLMHHPIIYEIAKINYTIDYCKSEQIRTKTNSDSFGMFVQAIDAAIHENDSKTLVQKPVFIDEDKKTGPSIDDAQKTQYNSKSTIMRRKTNTTKRLSNANDSNQTIQLQDKSSIRPPQSNTRERSPQTNQKSHHSKLLKKSKNESQQLNKQNCINMPQKTQIENEKLVDLSSFMYECTIPRLNPNLFIRRRSTLHKLYLPFALDPNHIPQIEFIDPKKPNENQIKAKFLIEAKEQQFSNKLEQLKSDSLRTFIIDPSVDKVAYLFNPNSKTGRIIQRFTLKSKEMTYEDLDLIAEALLKLSSEYFSRDEIIDILFDIIWTQNPSKYPIIPRVDSFWIPYIMDLIPAATDPPYLNEKWKRMTFHELSQNTEWPLKKAVDSLFDLYLTSNPFEIGKSFLNTIHLVTDAIMEMAVEQGEDPDEVEIGFDQLFSLLIICIFSSGLPTITKPLSYASYFDQYACNDSELHFAMTHMQGLSTHLPKINFKELREKSDKLKAMYEAEEKAKVDNV